MMTRRYFWIAAGVWTIAVAASLAWNLIEVRARTVDGVLIQARTAYEKDVIYRRWNSESGGIWAAVGYGIKPNPYLELEDRDINAGGLDLTMINPAYMTRLVHEIQNAAFGVKGHITSLNPLRPENAPDSWEAEALKKLESAPQLSEVYAVEDRGRDSVFRLMKPLVVEKGCLKCHEKQGYKVGDIRGGISSTVPVGLQLSRMNSLNLELSVGHGFLWVLGLVGLFVPYRRLGSSNL